MNKTTKGAVAVGAAAVLLLGGAGSLAYWNATASVDGGQIEAGELTLTPVADTGEWTFNGTTVADPTAVVVVPGDQLEYTGSYTIGAEGDNLQAGVTVTGGAAAGTLAPFLTTGLAYTIDGTASVATITEDDDGEVLAVDLDIAFPFGSAVDNTSQGTTLDLSALAITLTQTDATP